MKNNPPDQGFPACGYGLSGLCCSACLSGPCRISPFDRDTDRGKCGASADQLVAGNLLQMIAAETTGCLADLTQRVNQYRAVAFERPAASSENPETAKDIFDKYDLDLAAFEKTGGAGLLAGKVEDLLSAHHPTRDLNPLLSRLYPENVFPQFYSSETLPAVSLTLTVMTAFQSVQNQGAAVEDILRTCLKISLIYLVCQELIQDFHLLHDEKPSRVTPSAEAVVVETLDPALPSGGAVLLSAPEQRDDGLNRKSKTFRKQWQGPLIEISRPAELFDISRQFYRRWSRPVVDTVPLVVALTPSAAQIVGTLACGYTVISWPGLPLFGSEPVRRFFSEDLKQVFGSIYLPPEAGDILSVAQTYCRKVP